MEQIEQYLLQIVSFFTNNYIAAAVLAVVVIIMAVKKRTLLFQVIGLIALGVAILYLMIFLEKSMFTGVTSKERGIEEIDRQIK